MLLTASSAFAAPQENIQPPVSALPAAEKSVQNKNFINKLKFDLKLHKEKSVLKEAAEVTDSAVKETSSGAPEVQIKPEKTKTKKIFRNLGKKAPAAVEAESPKINENADIFSSTDNAKIQKPKAEIKSISQIEEDKKNMSRGERRRVNHETSKMDSKARQADLADKVSSDSLDEKVTESTTIKGGVEENVLVTIDDCVKLALINNPTIRYAMSNSDIYKSKIAQAWSAFFPEFSVGTAFSKNKFLPTNFKVPQTKYDLWNAVALQGSLLLYDFGKTQAKAKMARTNHAATVSDLQTALNDTVYNVKAAYFQYLYALRQQQVLQSTVDKFGKHYLEAKAGYEVGVKAKIDVVTAEYNLSNAKLDLIKAKNQVEISKAQLNNTMGLPSYSNYNVTDKLDINEYNLDFEQLMNTAYELRPELKSIEQKAEASRIMVKASKLAFVPDLKGFGQLTVGGKEYADDYGYQLGLQLTYPTTNFFLLKEQVNEAKATYERDRADIERKRNDVYLDVKSSYLDYKNAKDSVPVAHKAMNEAKMQYEIAAGRYKTGLSTAIELKDAEVTYRNAQLNYYNSLMQYNTSVASVEKMVGAPIKPDKKEGEINPPVDVNL